MPRHAALSVLSRWEPMRNNIEDLLENPLRKLDVRDASLTRHLVEEIVLNLRLLDYWIDQLAKPVDDAGQRPRHLENEVRNILRLGLAQLQFTRIPVHAALDATVQLAPQRAKGFINALLRRVTRQPALLDLWAESAPPDVRWSVSSFLWKNWVQQFGEKEANQLGRLSQQPADLGFFVNPFVSGTDLVSNHEDVHPWPGQEGYLKKSGIIPSSWFTDGLICVQDPAAKLAVDMLRLSEGEKVLDACAAPGGKTMRMAVAGKGRVNITATDLHGERLERLRGNMIRWHVPGVSIVASDWLLAPATNLGGFDAILVDAPCTNSGVLRRRLDARHRFTRETLEHAVVTQRKILDAVAPLVAPGGRIVYSTCSLEMRENEDQVKAFLVRNAGWKCSESARTDSLKDGIDGHFAARLEKIAGR